MKRIFASVLLFAMLVVGLSMFTGCSKSKSKSFKSDYPIDDFFDMINNEDNYTITYKETNNGTTNTYKVEFTKNRVKYTENNDDPIFVEFKGKKAYVYKRGYSTWIKQEDDEGYFEMYFAEIKKEFKKKISKMNSSSFEYDEKEECYKSKGDNTKIKFKEESVYIKSSEKSLGSTTVEIIFKKIGGTKINLPKAKKVD